MNLNNYFLYNFEGVVHRYTPDFYLTDLKQYVEIKGYKTAKDQAKWDQFPKDKKLDIYFGDDFSRLNIIPDAKTKGNEETLEKVKKYIEKHLTLDSI